ncbi:unnamed protein product [Polarella glacialis]|uniref:Uncharacterized protein n=1 Tax=Polarella glacialis TaxID=89957 RepID=A0A813D9D3_POLGL|nr:unnamed protein product [Polarella glacialis]
MGDSTWKRLRLPVAIKEAMLADYKSTLRLQAAYDSRPEARALILTYVKATATDEEIEEFCDELYDWAVHNQAAFKRLRTTAIKFRTEEGHCWSEGEVRSGTLAADLFEEMGNTASLTTVVVRTHRKSSLSIKLCQEGANKEEIEEQERVRWAGVLAVFIRNAALPVCIIIDQTATPALTWTKVFGDRRALTLRNRARTWKTVVEWLYVVFGIQHPIAEFQLIDYLGIRGEEPCGKTVPQAIAAALAVIEEVGRVPEAERISCSSTWVAVVDSWTARLAIGHTTRKRAELYPIVVMLSLELMVASVAPDFIRAWAWVLLLKVWMCLRTDDLQGVDHTRMVLSTTQLRCVLTRTKTTGPGKRTLEVATFVSRKASLLGVDWVSIGYGLWSRPPFNFARGYFTVKATRDFSSCCRAPASNALVVAYDRVVLAHLKVVFKDSSEQWIQGETDLMPESLVNLWSGHSARHQLPSMAAALRIEKERRDYLGRWGVDGGGGASNDYVLTSRQVVLSVQEEIARALCEGNPSYDEDELLEKIQTRLTESEGAHEARRFMKGFRVLIPSLAGPSLGQSFPMAQAAEEAAPSTEALVNAATRTIDPAKESPFWVSITKRTRFRRLHVRHGCGVISWQVGLTESCWSVKEAKADAICKDCAKQIGGAATSSTGSSSTSGSSSSSEPGELEPANGVKFVLVDVD